MMIPKIFFTYWEGKYLSKLHYYTVYSLVKLNPGVPITIYTSIVESNKIVQWQSGEQTPDEIECISLNDILSISDNIKLVQIDFVSEYKIKNEISCVFKADFTRICKLYEHGGMWFDFDILFVKPIPDELFKLDSNILYFRYSETIPTGLLFSSAKNIVIEKMYFKCLENIKNVNSNSVVGYQTFGPNIWNEFYHSQFANTLCLKTECVYPYIWNTISQFFESSNDLITENTFGIHWYNGGKESKKYIKSFDIEKLNPEKYVIDKYLTFIKELS